MSNTHSRQNKGRYRPPDFSDAPAPSYIDAFSQTVRMPRIEADGLFSTPSAAPSAQKLYEPPRFSSDDTHEPRPHADRAPAHDGQVRARENAEHFTSQRSAWKSASEREARFGFDANASGAHEPHSHADQAPAYDEQVRAWDAPQRGVFENASERGVSFDFDANASGAHEPSFKRDAFHADRTPFSQSPFSSQRAAEMRDSSYARESFDAQKVFDAQEPLYTQEAFAAQKAFDAPKSAYEQPSAPLRGDSSAAREPDVYDGASDVSVRRKRPLQTREPYVKEPAFAPAQPQTPLPPRRHAGKDPARRRTRRVRGVRTPPSTAKVVAIALCICICAFFLTATIRILFIPTEETVYVFDGSQAEYVLTDDYIPPATMPVVSNVAWDGGDALALLETSQLIGSSGASLLSQADAPNASGVTSTVRVCIASTGQVVDMDLEEYLVDVVAAEVPASYNVEAIKAQAVAARTYTVRRMASLGGAPDGKGGDVCTSAAHCQAYYSTDELRSRWGGSFDKYYAVVRDAVYSTQGLILTYDGAPINAFYHANSGGRTANCEDVFVQALPYLRAVDSPGESAYSSYSSTKTLSRAEFAAVLSSKTGAAIDAASLESLVSVASRTDSGRIYRINIAGSQYKGTTFQSWFSLRSTNIQIAMDSENVTMTVLGYGHGVGMSQTGANAMAGAGNSYATILKHYYSGVDIRPYA